MFVFGAVAAVEAVSIGVGRFLDTFRVDGVHWDIPVASAQVIADGLTLFGPEGPITADRVQGTTTSLNVVVPNLSSAASFSLGAAIVVGTMTALAVMSCIGMLAWHIRRTVSFTPAISRLVRALTWTAVLGCLGSFMMWRLGGNAVASTLSVRARAPDSLDTSAAAIAAFLIVTAGLIDIAARRSVKLQRETDGLV